MSTATAQPTTAKIREKEIQRIKDKLDLMRQREKSLVALADESVESRRVSKSIDTLQGQVHTIQKNLLNNYREEFVECRDMGHTWKVKSASAEEGRMYRILTCSRCHTVREEIISRYGDSLFRKYTHPDGYLLSSAVKGTIGYSKSFWRGLAFMRSSR